MSEEFVFPEDEKQGGDQQKKYIMIAVGAVILLCCCCGMLSGLWWLWNNGDALLGVGIHTAQSLIF